MEKTKVTVVYVDWRDRTYEPEIIGVFHNKDDAEKACLNKEAELASKGFRVKEDSDDVEVRVCTEIVDLDSETSRFEWAKGLTNDESIDQILENEQAADEVCNIILEEMESDGDSEPYSLLLNYQKADRKERAAMDAVLINLCGWSMESIIDKALEQYPGNDPDED